MATPIVVSTRDGPVTRWALEHAEALILEADRRQSFGESLAKFRSSRNGGRPISCETSYSLTVEGLTASIKTKTSFLNYSIILKVDEASIAERFTIRESVAKKTLMVWIKIQMPTTLVNSLVGGKVDKLVSLPRSIHSIIAGRTILEIKTYPESSVSVELEGDPA